MNSTRLKKTGFENTSFLTSGLSGYNQLVFTAPDVGVTDGSESPITNSLS